MLWRFSRQGSLTTPIGAEGLKKKIYFRTTLYCYIVLYQYFVLIEIYEHVFLSQKTTFRFENLEIFKNNPADTLYKNVLSFFEVHALKYDYDLVAIFLLQYLVTECKQIIYDISFRNRLYLYSI